MELNYSSSFRFLLSKIFFFHFALLVLKRTRLFFYKKRKLVKEDRIKVLELVLEQTIKNYNHHTSQFQIMKELYGPLWSCHPDGYTRGQYYNLILESSVETKDLNKTEQEGYKLAPKALATLSNYEEDERRHCDQVILQRILIIVTIALVLVGLSEVILIWQLSPKAT